MRTIQHGERGMTIMELMISMTVLAVVIGWVLVAFSNQHHNQLNHERVIEAQHEGRLITDLMVTDLRMAGFMVPTYAGIGSVDGGPNNSDFICMSDAAVMDPTVVSDSNQRFPAATANGGVGPGASTVAVPTGDLDIDGDGDNDFAAGSGIIIADDDSVHCAKITGIVGAAGTSTITYTPTTPGGFNASAPLALAAPAVFYEVNGMEMRRNDTVLSNVVEDVQVEYWVDADADSVMDPAEFPIHDLAGNDLADLKLARVSVTSRTEVADRDMAAVGGGFPAVANRVAGAADDFKRRRQIAETLLRNMR